MEISNDTLAERARTDLRDGLTKSEKARLWQRIDDTLEEQPTLSVESENPPAIRKRYARVSQTFTNGLLAAGGLAACALVIALVTMAKPVGASHPTAGAAASAHTGFHMPAWVYPSVAIAILIAVFMPMMDKESRRPMYRFFRLPSLWLSVAGMIVGSKGIPMTGFIPAVPEEKGYIWQLQHPLGFYIPSVLIFGTIGCLFGLLIQQLFKMNVNRWLVFWTNVVCAIALISGMMGLYRNAASSEQAMFQPAAMGLSDATFVGRQLRAKGTPTLTEQQRVQYAKVLFVAGADLGSANMMTERYRGMPYMLPLASYLSDEGSTLLHSTNPKQIHAVEIFMERLSVIIDNETKQGRGLNSDNIPAIIQKADKLVPPGFDGLASSPN